MSSKTYTSIVKVSETTLTDHLIDNLASEFYGLIMTHTPPTPNEITVDFHDLIHWTGDVIGGDGCREGFELAMSAYHLEGDE